MLHPERFVVGQGLRVKALFKNTSGVVADPTGLTFRYRNGTGTSTVLTYGVDGALVKDATGRYHVDISPDAEGTWHTAYRATGAVVAAEEVSFVVDTNF